MDNSLLNSTALREILVAAKFCIDTEKDMSWGHNGRLGFPAAILLLTFIDSAGYLAFIKDTADDKGEDTPGGLAFDRYIQSCFTNLSNTKKKKIKEVLFGKYRGYLLHQSGLRDNTSLSIGTSDEVVTGNNKAGYRLHLVPLFDNCYQFLHDKTELIEAKSQEGTIGVA
jgi:hypothetical protein